MGMILLDANEVEIAQEGGLVPILDAATSNNMDLQSQAARALRNLSVNGTSLPRVHKIVLTSCL